MLRHNGVNSSSSSAAIDGISSNRNGSETPADDRRMRRQIANCNERRRMQSINAGFQALRSLLPRKDGEKMSKAAILQHTADYIQALQEEKMRLVDENNAIGQCKKRRMGSEYIENMDAMDSSIPVIKQSQGNQTQSTVTPVEVMEYLRTIDDLKLALSKEHRLRVIYEREVIEMKTKSMQEANSLGVLRAAAGVQSLLSSQSLNLDSVLHRSDSSSLMMPTPQSSHLSQSAASTDSLLLAASQQVYNNVLFNAAAAVATTPPALTNVTTSQLSPHHQHHHLQQPHHHHANVITHPSSPYHTSQIHPTTLGDLVVSTTSGGLSPPSCIIETPVSLNGNHLAAAVSMASPTTLAAITTNPIAAAAAAAAAANSLPRQNAQLTQRNLQAIIEAIRHIEGNNMANRVAATSSPSPHSTDLLVR
uniref:BHLH domain-containing protein n=1 Tax=Panagrolaimus superbus TaxID=310955 RepID=A0A914ZDQ8_9BILA